MSTADAFLQSLLSSTDPFDYAEAFFADIIYPPLPQAFWVQGYVTVVWLCLIIFVLLSCWVVRQRHGRFQLWKYDGALSRLDYENVVPILWWLNAVHFVALFFWIRAAFTWRGYNSHFGQFWWTSQLPLVLSYALISYSMLCNAPIFRRMAIRINEILPSCSRILPSVVLLNVTFLLYACGLCLAFIPAARMQGEYFQALEIIHESILAVIDQARDAQDITVLGNLDGPVQALSTTNDHNAGQIGGTIYSSFIGLFLLTAMLPFLHLRRHIRQRIAELEATQSEEEAASPAVIPVELKVGRTARGSFIPLPTPAVKDAPFSNLAVKTTTTPLEFQKIMDSHDKASIKAKHLREELRVSQTQFVAYTCLLLSFAAIGLFQAFDGTQRLGCSQKQSTMIYYAWPTWNFLISASVLVSSYAYATFKYLGQRPAELDHEMPDRLRTPVTAIRLQQHVEIAEDIAYDLEKSCAYQDKRSYQPTPKRYHA